jgi:hypothetical protein
MLASPKEHLDLAEILGVRENSLRAKPGGAGPWR